MHLYYLDDGIYIVYCLMMLLWREYWYTVYVLYCRCVSPFACVVDRFTLFMVGLV